MTSIVAAVCALAVAAMTGAAANLERDLPRDTSVAYRLLWGAAPGTSVASVPLCGMTEREVRSALWSLRAQFRVMPRDAAVDRSTGAINPERDGLELDVEATCRAVMSAGEGEQVAPVMTTVPPRIRADDIRRLKRTRGAFATSVAGSAERRENIRLAARYLDYTVLAAGQTFSFLETLGPTSYERGFVDAPVIVGEEFVPGPGGGVCQVATTIYNAALESGLPVIERHRHTKPVGYVAEGRDAVVASWGLDLKLVNSLDHPVMLRLNVSDGVLTAKFLGP
ncbi:MAG: VanW family protein [Ignavibacteriales bacterium]